MSTLPKIVHFLVFLHYLVRQFFFFLILIETY